MHFSYITSLDPFFYFIISSLQVSSYTDATDDMTEHLFIIFQFRLIDFTI